MIRVLKPLKASWRDLVLAKRILRSEFPERLPDGQMKLSFLERGFMACLVLVRSLSLVNVSALFASYPVQSALSEGYVVLWLAILTTLATGPELSPWVVWILVGYRMVDALDYRLCILFVDRYQSRWGLRSLNRSLILLMLNYFEIVLGFAALYRGPVAIVGASGSIREPVDAVYFSVVTITTVGYGDFWPADAVARLVVSGEVVLGFVLVVLVLGSFLTGSAGMERRYSGDQQGREG